MSRGAAAAATRTEGVVLVVQAARAECGGAEPALVEMPPLPAEAPPVKSSEQSRHG